MAFAASLPRQSALAAALNEKSCAFEPATLDTGTGQWRLLGGAATPNGRFPGHRCQPGRFRSFARFGNSSHWSAMVERPRSASICLRSATIRSAARPFEDTSCDLFLGSRQH